MASCSNKKLSILYILKILQEYSDEKHLLTQQDIVKKLYSIYGLECERKSIGASLDSLEDFGYDIIKTNKGCYLGAREFEPSEISFLVDAIFSSKTLNSRQAKDLADKLSQFLSNYEKKKYKYIYKSNEISRADNKQLFYNIEIINEAIENGKQVKFTYNKYGMDKQLHARQNGRDYLVNPYFMVNSQGKYYLVCNYDYFDEIANYKIEQISNIQIVDAKVKPIKKLKNCENGIDISKYINENIYMFGGKTISATFKIDNDWGVNQIIEWFGNNVKIYEKDNIIYANVQANENALIYWSLQYGQSIELIEPKETRKEINKIVNILRDKYKGDKND